MRKALGKKNHDRKKKETIWVQQPLAFPSFWVLFPVFYLNVQQSIVHHHKESVIKQNDWSCIEPSLKNISPMDNLLHCILHELMTMPSRPKNYLVHISKVKHSAPINLLCKNATAAWHVFVIKSPEWKDLMPEGEICQCHRMLHSSILLSECPIIPLIYQRH